MDLLKLETSEVLQIVEKHFGKGCSIVCKERLRQVREGGYDGNHDDRHPKTLLSIAGVAYALDVAAKHSDVKSGWKRVFRLCALRLWPFDSRYFNITPTDPVKQLTKAATMIIADIDKFNRIKK